MSRELTHNASSITGSLSVRVYVALLRNGAQIIKIIKIGVLFTIVKISEMEKARTYNVFAHKIIAHYHSLFPTPFRRPS